MSKGKNAHPQKHGCLPFYFFFHYFIDFIWTWCMKYEAKDENKHKLQLFHRRQYILLHFNVLRAIVKCSKFDLITSKRCYRTSTIEHRLNNKKNIFENIVFSFASFGCGNTYVQCLKYEKLKKSITMENWTVSTWTTFIFHTKVLK